jgi:Ca2+-binding EF-hand superfamily protein
MPHFFALESRCFPQKCAGLVSKAEFEECYLTIHREIERAKGVVGKDFTSVDNIDLAAHIPGVTFTADDGHAGLYNQTGGAINIRTRLHEVFRASDVNGKPAGVMDKVELATKVNKTELVLALEGCITAKDDGSRAYAQDVARSLSASAEGTIVLQDLQDAFSLAMRIVVVAPTPMAISAKVRQLFAAMDTNNDGMVSKMEFVEFIRQHKPRYGAFSTVSKLQSSFGFNDLYEISPEDFQIAFSKLAEGSKGQQLNPDDFEFEFADGSDGMFMPVSVTSSGKFLKSTNGKQLGRNGGAAPRKVPTHQATLQYSK